MIGTDLDRSGAAEIGNDCLHALNESITIVIGSDHRRSGVEPIGDDRKQGCTGSITIVIAGLQGVGECWPADGAADRTCFPANGAADRT